jgi:ferredoxin-type protein NapH
MSSLNANTGRVKRLPPPTAFRYRRFPGYVLGFALFYAPFALWTKALGTLLGDPVNANIHSTCLRIQLTDLFSGKGFNVLTVYGMTFVILSATALLAGPMFCGRLCAAGATSEYLSRLVPDRFKIDWTNHVNPTGIRYGFLAGYLAAPFAGGSIACALCSYSMLERIMTGNLWSATGFLASSAIITALLWLVLFGLFTKGGRGYCAYMCPVGAWQSGLHALGAKLPFTFKIRYAADKCTGCATCVKECPMNALKLSADQAAPVVYNRHGCITCRQCVASCATGALSFAQGADGWKRQPLIESLEPDAIAEPAE